MAFTKGNQHMPNYLTASHDIADWCAARKLNDAVVKHWIKTGRAVDELTVAGIPRADIAELGPAAKTFLTHHMPPKECRETWPTLPPKVETMQEAPSAAAAAVPVEAGPTARAPLSPVMAALERNSKRHGRRDSFDGWKAATPAARPAAPETRPTEALVSMQPESSADWARRQPGTQADADALWSKAIAASAPKPGRLA
jgi:hypothetical protein